MIIWGEEMSTGHPTQITTSQTGAVSSTHYGRSHDCEAMALEDCLQRHQLLFQDQRYQVMEV